MADTPEERSEPAWWSWLVLALAGLAAHGRELAGGHPFFRDSHQVYVPAKMYLAEQLRAGVLPQWWPFDGGGSPLIPQPVFSVFHPTTPLYLIAPFWTAFALQNLCATLGALFGAYALARALGQGRAPATIAGLVYGLCGYLVCLSEHQFMKLAAGTMPWYLAAIIVSDRRGGRWLLGPGLAMGLILIAGDPQIAILSSASGVVLAAVLATRRRQALVTAIVSPALGALLAAIQLVPSLLIVPETERGGDMSFERWAMEWRHVAGLFVPTNFGPEAWVHSTFLGWAGAALVAFSLLELRRPERRRVVIVFWLLSAVSIWLAFGKAGGLNQIAKMVVPLWGSLRYPMKSLVLASLMLGVLAGFGFAALPLRRGMAWAGVVIIAVQSAWFASSLFEPAPAGFYEPSPVVQALKRDGIGLMGGAFDRPFAGENKPELWAEYSRAGGGGLGTSYGAIFGLPSLTPSMPGASWRVLRFLDEKHREVTNGRLLGVLGVQDIVMARPVDERLKSQVVLEDAASFYDVIRLKHRLERAYVTPRARSAASGAEAIELVSRKDFAPGREIIVEAPTNPEWGTRPESPAMPAKILGHSANEVRITAELPWPGFVVLNETNFRGWSATVDGQPTPVLTANGLVRAVEVSPGTHEVLFQFQTPGLMIGALISLLAVVLLLFAFRLLSTRPTAAPIG